MTTLPTHDIHIGGKYYTSLYSATAPQIAAAIFDLIAELGSEDVKVYISGTSNLVDSADHYPDGDEGVEVDHDYQMGDKYPDPTDGMQFDDGEEDITDLIIEHEPIDMKLVEHYYELFRK